jgi:RNA recognition motif-containing protein
VLVPLFEEFGRIYELRLMLDFNGAHRGFAYVKFCEIGSARAAAEGLDRRQVFANKLHFSQNNFRSFVYSFEKLYIKKQNS